ncbi:membrane-associated tyrosine- and threonine-specific cdc2-inhibitory kinase [Hypanus sabinus]|uniref:membrane-associated tyrosine- and threonine-specific cdc2-inhibitory kinase n=1 Tax=Hypanus sabinus TaxID=79690 RepID=UPI0028C39D93|nr:membrane-associated tyrosine- and threonine-specific cdc2-inhibitory kinase [Hypanus sabinus]
MGESPLARTPLPVPAFFQQAQEPHFSKKKGRGEGLAAGERPTPRPPVWGGLPLTRVFPNRARSWTRTRPRSVSASLPLNKGSYDGSKDLPYFEQCFQRISQLGRGSFGDVFKVRSRENGRLYAVKRSRRPFRGERDRRRCLAEARRHEGLGPHPNLLTFVRAWEERGQLYIQTELCEGGSLQGQLVGALPETRVWEVLSDLLCGLGHLHRRGLAHLDVKPANVLLGAGGICKLGDFGLVLPVERDGERAKDEDEEEAQEGDPRYMAPELLDGVYGTAADVFSLGMSILDISSNLELPRSGEGWQRLRRGYLPPEFVSGLSPALRDLLRLMLEPDPRQRPTVEELLSLPALRRVRRWRHLRLVMLSGLERALVLWQFLLSLLFSLWRVFCSPLLQLLFRRPSPPPSSPPPSGLNDSSLFSDWEDSIFGDDFFERHHSTAQPKVLFPSHSEDLDSNEFSFLSGSVTKPSLGSTSTPRNLTAEHSSIRRTPNRASPNLSRIGGDSPLPFAEEDRMGPPSGRPALEPRNLLSLFESAECD